MAKTPFIPLELLEIDGLTLAKLVVQVNDNSRIIASHNHAGGGREVPTSSIISNTSFSLNEHAVLNVDFLNFLNRSSTVASNGSIYFRGGELYVRDFSGREIKITHEGGNFTNQAGQSRGALVADADLLTTGQSSGSVVNENWTADPNIPTGFSVSTTWLSIPDLPSSGAIIGVWVVSEIDGDEEQAVFLPFRMLSGTFSAIKISKASDNYATINAHFTDADGLRINLLSRSTAQTADANTKIKVYLADVRGAPGPAGPVGPAGGVDFSLPAVNTNEDIKFFVQESSTGTTNIAPAGSPQHGISKLWGSGVGGRWCWHKPCGFG